MADKDEIYKDWFVRGLSTQQIMKKHGYKRRWINQIIRAQKQEWKRARIKRASYAREQSNAI